MAVVASTCAMEVTVLPAAWWSFDPVLVAGTAEAVGSVILLWGGTKTYGRSFAAVEVILIGAAITGIVGFHGKNRKLLLISSFLVLSQAVFVGMTLPIDLDNLSEFVAAAMWLAGIVISMKSFGTARRPVNSKYLAIGATILAIGMIFDAAACAIDIPGLATALHIDHLDDAVTWFNVAPMPGLILLTWVLATGRFRNGIRWLASMGELSDRHLARQYVHPGLFEQAVGRRCCAMN